LAKRQNADLLQEQIYDPSQANRLGLLRELYSLPDNKIMDKILEHENPQRLIQELPVQDFFWLVKKIGDDDCLLLLEMATEEQWQYLLDLEIWRKDSVDKTQTAAWIKRLQLADCKRLVRWLFSEGQDVAFLHFSRHMDMVTVSSKDEAYDLPEGFVTLDGFRHFRVLDSEQKETLEEILREMANQDFMKFDFFLKSLAQIIPAEMEEEMYRLRTSRIAEHGFLPFEEAISVYAPLDAAKLDPGKPSEFQEALLDHEIRAIVPASPLHHVDTRNILMECASTITDPLLMDRFRLEFAGLCNQILSAEGMPVHEIESLRKVSLRASRYLNLALERLCGRDLSSAEEVLRRHALSTVFRVGFGMALKLKWEAERWLKASWFYKQGLGPGFWGEHWAGMIEGLFFKRPQFYVGSEEKEEYKDFEWLSEIGVCLRVLRRLMVLDSLLQRLNEVSPADEKTLRSAEAAFRPFLFNFWARLLLKLQPSFSGILLNQTKSLFHRLRGDDGPPFRMSGFKERFIKDLMAYAAPSDSETGIILRETLAFLWQEFREEHEWIPTEELDGRYSKFVTITRSSDSFFH